MIALRYDYRYGQYTAENFMFLTSVFCTYSLLAST